MAPVVIDATGVGEYSALEGRPIPAHHFFALSGPGYKSHDDAGNFAVHGLGDSTILSFPHIRDIPRSANIVLRVAMQHASLALSVRFGSASGPQVCHTALPATFNGKDPVQWVDITCETSKPLPKEMSLVLVFSALDSEASNATGEGRLASLSFV